MGKKALNAAEMKLRNQKKIVEILITSACSRAELARKVGLTRAAISIIVDELIEQKMIVEGNPILGKIGRKSFVLKLNPDYCFMIGINLARDGYRMGAVNFCGESLYDISMPLMETAADTLAEISKRIREMLGTIASSTLLMGIGVTAPGPLDSKNGRILTPPNFEQWFHVDISSYFAAEFDCPVILENNANALALAEKYYGCGNLYKSYVELSVDTGIGSGVILNGRLYKGSAGFGNDFGHMSIHYDGPLCKCGNTGCAELYASIPNILRFAKTADPSFTSWETVVERAALGDHTARQIVEKEAAYLAVIITNIMNILDVDAIIMSSTITYMGEYINELIRERVNKQFFSRLVKEVHIVSSSISAHAPVLSAANLVLEHFLSW